MKINIEITHNLKGLVLAREGIWGGGDRKNVIAHRPETIKYFFCVVDSIHIIPCIS